MKHRIALLIFSVFMMLLSQREVSAQSIPLMIPHSGTVTVSGAPFNGNGQFKFAIVNKDCTLDPIGAACATLWSNDNTLGAGIEPVTAVTLPITNGAFTVKLGDTSLTNMVAIPTNVFNNAETFLRVWFNDGVTGSQQLSPDRQLVSVPYAYKAEVANSVAGSSRTRFLYIPALALIPGGGTTVNSFGLSFPQGFTNSANGMVAVPDDWDRVSNFIVDIYFTPETATAGVVSFFIRPAGRTIGESMFDPGSVSAQGVSVPASSASKLFVQSFTVTGRVSANDEIFHLFGIQRGGTGETFADNVTLRGVRIRYTAN